MGKRKLDAYRGKLSAAQVAEGMNAAANNARRLAEDAATLLELGRFPTASSLAILSIEETGKISILRGLALATSETDAAKEWKAYRSHTRKNAAWLLPQLLARGAQTVSDLRPLFDESSDHRLILDQVKQLGFYTDCLGPAHWAIPASAVDEPTASGLVKIAQIFSRTESEHTEREVELWIEHMAPVWKNGIMTEQALVNWYAAMQQEGLAPEGLNETEQFVYYGLKKPN